MTNENKPDPSSNNKDPELITSLFEISNAINALMEVDDITEIIIDHCLSRIRAEQGMVYLLDKDQEEDNTKFKTFFRGFADNENEVPLHVNQSLAAIILKNKTVLSCNDTDSDPTFKGLKLLDYGIKSLLSAPLITRRGIIGIIILINRKDDSGFTDNNKRFLGIIGTQVAKVIEAAQLQERELKLVAIQEELKIAHRIQEKFLSAEDIESDSCSIHGTNIPAKDLGGDFYDIVELAKGRVFVSLGDVMGKGIPAALIMANAMAILRSGLTRAGKYFLAEIADSLNNMVFTFTPPEQFITSIFGEYVCQNKSFNYVNAGHPPIIIIRADGKVESPSGDENDLAIGIMPNIDFSISQTLLNSGDMIFIYSDGIPECFAQDEEAFGEERLTEFLKYNHTLSPQEITKRIIYELHKFKGDAETSDDITFVIIKAK